MKHFSFQKGITHFSLDSMLEGWTTVCFELNLLMLRWYYRDSWHCCLTSWVRSSTCWLSMYVIDWCVATPPLACVRDSHQPFLHRWALYTMGGRLFKVHLLLRYFRPGHLWLFSANSLLLMKSMRFVWNLMDVWTSRQDNLIFLNYFKVKR